MPGVASLDHFEVDVFAIGVDCAEDASVLVAALVSDADVFAEDERRKMLLRLLSESLMRFGCVDSVEADFVLGGGGRRGGRDGYPPAKGRPRSGCPRRGARPYRDQGERVAVGDLYDAAADFRKRRVGLRARPRVEGRYAALRRTSTPPLKISGDAAERKGEANPPAIASVNARADLAFFLML